jgi:hypothetical protein
MTRGIAVGLGFLLLAFGIALGTGAERPVPSQVAASRPIVAPVETNPCSVAGACW